VKYKFNDLSYLVTDGDLKEFQSAIDDMFAINARLSNNDHLSLSFFMVANKQFKMLDAYYKKYRMKPEEAYSHMLAHLSTEDDGKKMAKFIAQVEAAIPIKSIEKEIKKLADRNEIEFLTAFMNELDSPKISEETLNALARTNLSDEERKEDAYEMRHKGASEDEITRRNRSCQQKKLVIHAYTGKPLDRVALDSFRSAFVGIGMNFESASLLFNYDEYVNYFKESDDHLSEYMTPPNTGSSRNEP